MMPVEMLFDGHQHMLHWPVTRSFKTARLSLRRTESVAHCSPSSFTLRLVYCGKKMFYGWVLL